MLTVIVVLIASYLPVRKVSKMELSGRVALTSE